MTYNLNLGCGKLQKKSTPEEDWLNLDRADLGQQVVHDMTTGLPFKDNFFDFIQAIACLGQIERNVDFLLVMNELHRVLKPNHNIFIYLPHRDHDHCYNDPFNQRRTNEAHWLAFDQMSRQYVQHNSYYGFKPWTAVEVHTNKGFLNIRMVKP